MKKTLLVLTAMAVSGAMFAQNFGSYFKDGLYKFDDATKIMATEVFTTYASQFGFSPGDGMVMTGERAIDDMGGLTQRYVQYHNGYPVEGTMMNVISKYGVALYVNGFHLPGFTKNTPPPISEATALDAALLSVNAPKYTWQDPDLEQAVKYSFDPVTADTVWDTSKTLYPKGELVIAHPFGDTAINDTSKYALCWKFHITPMRWETLIRDTSTIDSIVSLDTFSTYTHSEDLIVYINATNGSVYTIDSNNYGAFWVNCGITPTNYLGNQSSQMRTCTICSQYTATDSRRFQLEDFGGGAVYHQGGINWSTSGFRTGVSAYHWLQVSWDYFDTYHGFSDGPVPGTRYDEAVLNFWGTGSSYPRTQYTKGNPTATGQSGQFLVAKDYSGSHASAAEVDIMAHEYTHAIIAYGPGLNRYGEAGAIQEGLCDIFGTYAASHAFPSRYYSNWANGFGWNLGDYTRSFSNPPSDLMLGSSYPGSARYADANFTGDIYKSSGLMRKWFYLLAFGGTHNGVHVNEIQSTSNLERDVFDGIGWMWSNLNYCDVRNQYLGLYEFRYGKCSEQWWECVKAWASVGVGTIPNCHLSNITGASAITTDQIGTIVGTFHIVPSPPGPVPGHEAISYNWIVPQPWTVSYSPDFSQMTLLGTLDYSSQTVSCIVAYADSTKDTLTTFLHIVDGEGNRNGNISQNIVTNSPDDVFFYPNPVKNNLNITLPTAPKNTMSFSVLDLAGREIYSTTINTKKSVVYLPTLAPGLYMARISGDGKEYLKKLTVQ